MPTNWNFTNNKPLRSFGDLAVSLIKMHSYEKYKTY